MLDSGTYKPDENEEVRRIVLVLEGSVQSTYIKWLKDMSEVLDAHMPFWQQNSKVELPMLEMVIRFHSVNKMYQIFAMRIGVGHAFHLLEMGERWSR